MLKRSVILFLIPLYLITASGFAISMHYCGKLLTGIEFNAPAKKCVTLAKLKCCKDKQINVKVKDAHELAAFAFKANNPFVEIAQQHFTIAFTVPEYSLNRICFNKAPPDLPGKSVPLFLQNCTFLI